LFILIHYAAHCFDSAVSSITAYVNTTNYGGNLKRKVTTILPHPGFAFKMTDPDLMLLKLESEVVGVPPLRLNSDQSVPVDLSSVTIIGLGLTSYDGSYPDQLLEADINIMGIDDCNDDSSFRNFIQGDRQICANAQGKDTCSGDSGSPLMYMDSTGTPTQVGLSSFGRGCGNVEFPGIFTRVSYYYRDWILPNICNMARNPPNECNALTANDSNLTATNAAVTPSPTTKSPTNSPTIAPETPVTQQPSTQPRTPSPTEQPALPPPTTSPSSAPVVAAASETQTTQQPSTQPPTSSPTTLPPTSVPITITAQTTATPGPTFFSTRKSSMSTQSMTKVNNKKLRRV
jgi:hypothetical protein